MQLYREELYGSSIARQEYGGTISDDRLLLFVLGFRDAIKNFSDEGEDKVSKRK